MPWQRRVVDVATELTDAGLYRYPTVLVTVPRQSGKTTLVGPLQLHRILTRPGIAAFFTAQTGKDAHARMLDLIKLTTSSPLASLFKPRYAAGSAGLTLGNGSMLRAFAPGPSALHGETPHLVTLDEIWKHDGVAGAQLMGAIGPAQATLEGESQVWMISTMGTAQSEFMNELVERGRAGDPNLCYFEWSMADGLDPFEPQTWWTFHPALGNTITESYLASQRPPALPLGEYIRAYMNRLSNTADPLISDEDWAALNVEPLAVPSRRDVTVSYEVAPDGESAAVMASWRDTDGAPCIRTLHAAPGTSWLIPFLVWIVANWGARLAADDGGETRRITDELRRRGLEVYTLGAGEYATSCVALLSYARDGSLRQDGSRSLASAVAHAVLAPMGDSWRFSRKRSTGSIAALVAGAVGLWAHDHHEVLSVPTVYIPKG